jgi:DNA-binding GntR family transcriptional regulator
VSAPLLRLQAYEAIVERLVFRQLLPGQFVTQRELVELCGLPLGPIREAIPRLEANGLIATLRQRGLQIASIDVRFVRNAYRLRRILESEATVHAARRAPVAFLERLEAEHRAILARMADPLPEAVADEAQRVDWAMHEALIDFLDNELVTEVYRVNSIKVRMASQQRLRVTGANIGRVMHEHMKIIEALKTRDAEASVAAVREHIDRSMAIALGVEEDANVPLLGGMPVTQES